MRPERAVLRRILASVGLGLVVGSWLLVRGGVLAWAGPYRHLEFPVAALVVACFAWLAMRPSRARERPEAPWTRHEQVVRQVADPESSALEAVLDAWVEDGAAPHAAADVVSRALALDAAARAKLEADMAAASSRKKRESFLRSLSLAAATSRTGA